MAGLLTWKYRPRKNLYKLPLFLSRQKRTAPRADEKKGVGMVKQFEPRSKPQQSKSIIKPVILTSLAAVFILLVLLPITLTLFDGSKYGNVALIPISGVLTVEGDSYLGQATLSSETIVGFIEEAEDNEKIEAILLEINSPGGSAVASDEIAEAVKKAGKPVLAVIRETGASGGYWVASAADHVIANRMAVTGSIGVISSYLEFSGLMEEYGVGYERLVAGERKDIGTSFRKLEEEEKAILQKKINRIHDFFIEEIARNRKIDEEKVRQLATGEFYLGVEALQLGLIDQLGGRETAEEYLKENFGIEEVDYVVYEAKPSFFDLLEGVFSRFSFHLGEGLGSAAAEKDYHLMLI